MHLLRSFKSWEQFLDDNNYNLSDADWEQLEEVDDELYSDTRLMPTVIDNLKYLMEDCGDTPENIVEIYQEEPGGLFHVWTFHRVYHAVYVDWEPFQEVYYAWRDPDWLRQAFEGRSIIWIGR